MPLFDYRCRDCGETNEMLVRSSSAKVKCPDCGSENVERQLASFAVATGDRPDSESCDALSGGPTSCEGGVCPNG